ncbi:hypothetical protein NM208_g8739 [Fusarium decemcellulare]|uniref:Uncharacterized protein n=1 Tax=Fusarium decemcellulare TaxID=57161 RepID=A0ACC1S450_9HYPO|nr:hypothetical protein NM208_g8739 [Fusarium decemcellulare]
MTNTYCHAPVRDKTSTFVNVTIVLGVISGISILLRIGSKILITNSDFGLDDLFIILTLTIGIPSTAMNIHGTAGHGEGRDIWTLEFDQITRFGFFFWLLEVFYFAQVSLLKMSLLFFYLRIFPGPAQKLLWGTVIFNAIYGVAFIFLAIFQCSPISFFWTGWDGEHEGTCANVNAIGWANASVSIALDVWMLAIPMWYLRNLKLHWKKKIGVAAMFIVGTFVTIVSIIRLQFLVDLGSSHNPTYDQTEVSIWSTVEINVGIICASMPALRILLVRLFLVLGGSSYDSSKYNNYGEQYGRKSHILSRSRARVEIPSQTGDSIHRPDHGGIELQRTFKVQYSENDEQSLVTKDSAGTNRQQRLAESKTQPTNELCANIVKMVGPPEKLAAGEPLYIVEPQGPHTHTFILLHGLGSNGEKFGAELLDTGLTSSGRKLTELFPGARFVFPTSKRRRSTAFGRSMLTQWFDITRLEDPSYRKERQLDGLAESAREIREILGAELHKVQPQNLILGGLSQGCAMSLAVLLSLEHPVAGFIGMSGYFTYQCDLESAIKDEVDGDNPFEDPDEPDEQTSAVKAQVLQRDLLGLDFFDHPSQDTTAVKTPVFLGHGEEDDKVPYQLGEGAAQLIRDAGYQVDWKCYQNQGHWYKIPDQIDDICDFIVSKVGWEVIKATT